MGFVLSLLRDQIQNPRFQIVALVHRICEIDWIPDSESSVRIPRECPEDLIWDNRSSREVVVGVAPMVELKSAVPLPAAFDAKEKL
jgi:hypothetical protein